MSELGWADSLRKRFPWFPKEVYCGPGWAVGIGRLCEQIQEYLDANPDYAREFYVTQCKEKYSHLCLYAFPENEFIDDLVANTETGCEQCGAAATLRSIPESDGSARLMLLCDHCATN